MSEYYPVIIEPNSNSRLKRKVVLEKFDTINDAVSKAEELKGDGDFATFAPVKEADKLIEDYRVSEVVSVQP